MLMTPKAVVTKTLRPVWRQVWRIRGRLVELRRLALPSNEAERFEVVRRVAGRLLPEYKLTWPQIAWMRDPAFGRYLERFGEREGMNSHRHWTLLNLLRLVDAVPGDTAECGVFRGASSFLICKYNSQCRGFKRVHSCFDSFEGISNPTRHDGDFWTAGSLCCGIEEVQENLAEFTDVRFHKGWIPERFPDVEARRFAFVHIDVDLYTPTKDSVEFFYPRMSAGGIILCDDYGCTTCPGANLAIDEFLEDKPESMVENSCGGGFLIKNNLTAAAIVLE